MPIHTSCHKPWCHFITSSSAIRCYSPSLVLVGFVDDLVDPSQEPANTCVHPRERGVTTPMTPGNYSSQHPLAPIPLANQRTPTVTLATVHTVALRQAPGTQHAAGETMTVSFLALPSWKQGDPGLEQSPGVLWVWQQDGKQKPYGVSGYTRIDNNLDIKNEILILC